MEGISELMGMQKVNTVAYHPQTDGLVEKMNRTLRAMITKAHSEVWERLGYTKITAIQWSASGKGCTSGRMT